ncbi:MAG: DUF3566 domain-containing protein [Actinomycetota bacterium]|nr:DUF3566 domain-containing protein [Actinomycetota bacterium]
MTGPENAEQTEVQVASKEPETAAGEPTQKEPAQKDLSGNGANPAVSASQQRQRTTKGDGDPETVRLRVGAPEHSRGAVREQAKRQPGSARAYGFSPGVGPPIAEGATMNIPPGSIEHQSSQAADPDFPPPTVRTGGYTPQRVLPAPPPSTRIPPARVPRRTSLQLQRLEPWSVLKLSLVLSIAGFLVWMVAVGLLYGVLAGMGVWDQINGTYSDLTAVNDPQAYTELISGGRVFGVAFVVGLVNIVLMTALATVGSLVYNIAADLVGGVEVTLSEPD